METYSQMKDRHQQEVNDFPFGFAFGTVQFEEMMKKWGFDPYKDVDKIYDIGAGCFVRKEDEQAMTDMFRRHKQEREDAIKADKTGDGYIYQMFLYELRNHEFGYTGDATDAIGSLGYSYESIEADYRLSHGFEKAKNKIWGEE